MANISYSNLQGFSAKMDSRSCILVNHLSRTWFPASLCFSRFGGVMLHRQGLRMNNKGFIENSQEFPVGVWFLCQSDCLQFSAPVFGKGLLAPLILAERPEYLNPWMYFSRWCASVHWSSHLLFIVYFGILLVPYKLSFLSKTFAAL